MGRELHSSMFFTFIIFITINSAIPDRSEKDYLDQIKNLAASKQRSKLLETSKKFFNKYPKSRSIADVRLILAENEQKPEKSIEQYRILVNKYRFYKRRDYAQYKLCEILYLLSRWRELKDESLMGTRIFKNSRYFFKFQFLLAQALIHLEMFEDARDICLAITRRDHSYEKLSKTLLLLSYINRRTSGFSQSYLYRLRELIVGFSNSSEIPTAIYLLGNYYEAKGDYDRAHSAYIDLFERYPKSPVSTFCKRKIAYLKKYSPSKVDYIPEVDNIRKTDKIDIHPEIEIDDKQAVEDIIYSISLSYFHSLKEANKIRDLIKMDFWPIKILKIGNRYIIYVGRIQDLDSSISIKIRLAEEFGLNGKIVRMIRDSEKLYIYGE